MHRRRATFIIKFFAILVVLVSPTLGISKTTALSALNTCLEVEYLELTRKQLIETFPSYAVIEDLRSPEQIKLFAKLDELNLLDQRLLDLMEKAHLAKNDTEEKTNRIGSVYRHIVKKITSNNKSDILTDREIRDLATELVYGKKIRGVPVSKWKGGLASSNIRILGSSELLKLVHQLRKKIHGGRITDPIAGQIPVERSIDANFHFSLSGKNSLRSKSLSGISTSLPPTPKSKLPNDNPLDASVNAFSELVTKIGDRLTATVNRLEKDQQISSEEYFDLLYGTLKANEVFQSNAIIIGLKHPDLKQNWSSALYNQFFNDYLKLLDKQSNFQSNKRKLDKLLFKNGKLIRNKDELYAYNWGAAMIQKNGSEPVSRMVRATIQGAAHHKLKHGKIPEQYFEIMRNLIAQKDLIKRIFNRPFYTVEQNLSVTRKTYLPSGKLVTSLSQIGDLVGTTLPKSKKLKGKEWNRFRELWLNLIDH